MSLLRVTPAKAGVQRERQIENWILAGAGMTRSMVVSPFACWVRPYGLEAANNRALRQPLIP
jgi:hypothetical protein